MSDVPEMVERVAEAIYMAHWSEPAPAWEAARDGHKDWSRKQARAAIAAMREPTEAMIEAAGRDYDHDDFPNGSGQVWAEMIDAALSE